MGTIPCPVPGCKSGTVTKSCQMQATEAKRWSGCRQGTFFNSYGEQIGLCPCCGGEGNQSVPCLVCKDGFVDQATLDAYVAEQARLQAEADRQLQLLMSRLNTPFAFTPLVIPRRVEDLEAERRLGIKQLLVRLVWLIVITVFVFCLAFRYGLI